MKLTLLTILGLAATAPLDTDSATAEHNVDKKGVYMCQQKEFGPEGGASPHDCRQIRLTIRQHAGGLRSAEAPVASRGGAAKMATTATCT